MASDVESRILTRDPDGVIESGAVRHQGGRGENAHAVGLENSLVHIRGESEVIRVDD